MKTETLLQTIKNDLAAFHLKYGRYPTTKEMDSSDFHVSVRTIGRRFGGIKKLREILGLPIIDYSSTNGKNKKYEEENISLKSQVMTLIKEKFHPSHINDNLIRNKTKDFKIDFVYATDPDDFLFMLNKKLIKTYLMIDDINVIIVGGGVDINSVLQFKRKYLPPNFFVIDIHNLPQEINKYEAYMLQ